MRRPLVQESKTECTVDYSVHLAAKYGLLSNVVQAQARCKQCIRLQVRQLQK